MRSFFTSWYFVCIVFVFVMILVGMKLYSSHSEKSAVEDRRLVYEFATFAGYNESARIKFSHSAGVPPASRLDLMKLSFKTSMDYEAIKHTIATLGFPFLHTYHKTYYDRELMSAWNVKYKDRPFQIVYHAPIPPDGTEYFRSVYGVDGSFIEVSLDRNLEIKP